MVNSAQRPNDNMVWAILSTAFCCLPLGVVAIIKAAKVDGLYRDGDYEGAQKAADDAKKYATIGAGIFVVTFFIYFLILIIAAAVQ